MIVFINSAGALELELSANFLDACIKDIWDDTMSSEYLLSKTSAVYN